MRYFQLSDVARSVLLYRGVMVGRVRILERPIRGLLLGLGILVSVAPISSKSADVLSLQLQYQFEWAVKNRSTSPGFVLLTAIDDRTGQSIAGCTEAPFLLGAIARETGVSGDEARQIALSNTDHVFHFSKQQALDNLSIDRNPAYQRACSVIRSGSTARMNDIGGQISAGPFSEGPYPGNCKAPEHPDLSHLD
jgi:hypothetical protein